MDLKQELESRGFLHQYTHEELFALYEKWGEKLYWWVDPSSDSLQLGNFISLMNALHVMRRGNKLFLIVWWATGMIGNPSGKDNERNFLTTQQVAVNTVKIEKQIKTILSNVEKKIGQKMEIEVINNYVFFEHFNVLDFMRDVGKFMTVNWMMNKDIVKKRITDPNKSISYAEFSYMLIMGYDFYRLYSDYNVRLEVGWSDEWDGILSGVELIGKKTGQTAYWLTNKLVTDSNGKKFGKSEGNAVWLDPEKNSPYYVYQYLLNCADSDIEKLLNMLTFLEPQEIVSIVASHSKQPELRLGQKVLATYVVSLVFGDNSAKQAEAITNFLFTEVNRCEVLGSLENNDMVALMHEVGSTSYTPGMSILEALVKSELATSKSDARKLIEWGGVFLNEMKISEVDRFIQSDEAINWVFLLRKGKKNFRILLK